MDIEPGTIIANRYRVQKPLGRGGMGEVFAAENVRTGRVVAVKLLRADTKQKSSAVARFRREARAAGAIHSDYVTQVLDVEEDPEHGIVIVFEMLEGESLIDRLKRTGPMSFDELFPIVEQVWIGLADAHNSGVIHRDLKPSNVFLERRPDNSHRVKILDFGISKITREVGSETLTEMGQNLGTFSFMPPEQIGKAKTVDHRADIYSAATLIYQAMSGQLPYAARNILMIVELKTKAEPRKLGDVMDSPVDPRLEDFLAKALRREPDERYQTALEALEAWRALRGVQISSPETGSGGYQRAQVPPHPPSQPQLPQPAMSQPQQPQAQPSYASASYTPNPGQVAQAQNPYAQQPMAQGGMQQGGMAQMAAQAQAAARSQAPTAPDPGARGRPSVNRGTVAINEAALNPRAGLPSVADSTSDQGSDHVATVAIPLRKVADALASRGVSTTPSGNFDPAALSPSPRTPQSVSSPGAGLPKLHDDRPNLGTQVLPGRMHNPASISSVGQPAFQAHPSYAGGGAPFAASGSNPAYQAQQQAAQQRNPGTMAMNYPQNPQLAGSGAYPAGTAGASSASGAYPAAGASPQASPLAVTGGPVGPGQTARHVPVNPSPNGAATQGASAPPQKEELPTGDLQTAVFRRSGDGSSLGVPVAKAAPAPRGKAWLIVAMLGLLVLGFGIVTLVVTLATGKFPFAH